MLSCHDARTGEQIYNQRLGDGRVAVTASPVAANGRIYCTGEYGEAWVARAGPVFELIATNPMGEVCMAPPAISEGFLIFRTRSHLVAVGAQVD